MKSSPIEYKKGFKDFLNVKIDLSKKPLIPREETEYLAREILLNISNKKSHCLDIFAGSGCIGVYILKNNPKVTCDFADIDENNLAQISINLELNNIDSHRAFLIKTNIFSDISKKYDYIFANPPYVARERLNEVGEDVIKYEPSIAWYGGKKGIFYINKFLSEVKKYLKKDGMAFLEFDPKQREDIEKILTKEKCFDFVFFVDQYNKKRFVKISRC